MRMTREFLIIKAMWHTKNERVQLFVERTNFKVVQTKTPANLNNKNEAHNVIKTITILSEFASLLTAKNCCFICFTSLTIYQH